MALRQRRGVSNRHPADPEITPRLRLKRKAAITGYVDGAWWPRVTYNLAEWAKAPRKVLIGGRIIRLDGYHRQPHNTVGVLDASGNKIVLLVVPVHTEPDRAYAIVTSAAVTDNASSVDTLLS